MFASKLIYNSEEIEGELGMLKVMTDTLADAVYIYLGKGTNVVSYTKELDDNRTIDYSDEDEPVGVGLLNVSMGVETDDLPSREKIENLLKGLGIKLFA